MTDVLTPGQRSLCMSRIRGKDTRPEIRIRRAVHAMGFRFRLHVQHLPGRPDLVFPGRRKIIFVHGCFWHRHSCRFGRILPKTRQDFWKAKLEANKMRDRKTVRQLQTLGWKVLIVWECQLRQEKNLADRLFQFLND